MGITNFDEDPRIFAMTRRCRIPKLPYWLTLTQRVACRGHRNGREKDDHANGERPFEANTRAVKYSHEENTDRYLA